MYPIKKYDDESDTEVVITKEMQGDYFFLKASLKENKRRLFLGWRDMMEALINIQDKKLYLAGGYSSMEDYIRGEFQENSEHIINMLAIYRELGKNLSSNISFRTLMLLLRFPEDIRKELMLTKINKGLD